MSPDKKLDSQISYFSRKSRDLITKSNENSLLRDKKSRLSLEKGYFLLDRGWCMPIILSGNSELKFWTLPGLDPRYSMYREAFKIRGILNKKQIK